jgi:hypothetical protein
MEPQVNRHLATQGTDDAPLSCARSDTRESALDWDEVFSDISSIERLLSRRVDDFASLLAIEQAASRLERATVDEAVVDYARDIRFAASGDQLPAGKRISDTILGERIERLASHCRIAFARATLSAGRAASS